MSDLSSTLSYLATNKRIVDSAGDLVAERERFHGLKAFIVSQLILDAAGRPLFKVACRTSRSTGRVDVFTPDGAPIAHIKGRSFLLPIREYTIRDGSGLVIGRIDEPWNHLLADGIRLLDSEDRLRARGVRASGTEFAVEIKGGWPPASPWPELTAAYFLSRSQLRAPKPPP